ncbi:hypothetical protein D3C76_1468530 [compost metagenome]
MERASAVEKRKLSGDTQAVSPALASWSIPSDRSVKVTFQPPGIRPAFRCHKVPSPQPSSRIMLCSGMTNWSNSQ